MDLRELLRKVEAAPNGTTELDSEFASVFSSAPETLRAPLTQRCG